jgi:imidazolonepropionase-like amidohydrolase
MNHLKEHSTSKLTRLLFPAIACLFLVGSSSEGMTEALLIEHARLIDGRGGPPLEDVSILISDGKIVKVEQLPIDAPDATKLDASGLTAMPGLIDAHVHISSVPGEGFRKDSLAKIRELQRFHLRAYLASGVTTILDPGIPVKAARELQSWLSAGNPGPRLLVLSPAFSTPGGYVSDESISPRLFFPPVASQQDVDERFLESEGLNAIGVKVLMESGFGGGLWPIHPPEIRQAIQEGATKRNLPLYIHSWEEVDQEIAIDMQPHALVHGSQVGSDELIARLKANSVYMITTLSISDSRSLGFDPSKLDEPLYTSSTPPLELQTARLPEAWRNLASRFAEIVDGERPAEEEMTDYQVTDPAKWVANQLANVKKQHAAGLPIVMGSDSGNWPIMPHMFHGSTSIREVELLGMAGLSPMDAIQASTSISAQMLDLADEIGTIEVGKQADLVIVKEDPLTDLRALRTIQWTVRGGVAKSPKEWLGYD